MLTKLAYEAQSVAIRKMKEKVKNDKNYEVKEFAGPNAAVAQEE